jgi:hypothetical protein
MLQLWRALYTCVTKQRAQTIGKSRSFFNCVFPAVRLKDAVTGERTASNGWRDVKNKLGSAAVQFGALLQEFVWNNWGKTWETLIRAVGIAAEIRTRHLTEVSQKHWRLGRLSRSSAYYGLCQRIPLLYRIHVGARWRVVIFKLRSLYPRKKPRCPLSRRLSWPQSRSAGFVEEKNLLPLKGFEGRTVKHVT